MNEQIKTTTVDQLPEAASLDGLYVFGYASKNAVGKRSVKAPITLLKGNQGDIPTIGANGNWWISGKDTGFPAMGKDGDVTTEQLNQTIEEYMKTDVEKYEATLTLKMSNTNENVLVERLAWIQPTTSGKTIDYKLKTKSSVKKSISVTGSHLSAALLDAKDIVEVNVSGAGQLLVDSTAPVDAIVLSTLANSILTTFSAAKSSATNIDVSAAVSLKSLLANEIKASYIVLNANMGLESINIYDSPNLVACRLHGENIKSIVAYNCPKLAGISLSTSTVSKLELLDITNTAFTESVLMSTVEKWTSRVGQKMGVLKIGKALYESMTEENKQIIINKNITILYN